MYMTKYVAMCSNYFKNIYIRRIIPIETHIHALRYNRAMSTIHAVRHSYEMFYSSTFDR